MGMTVDIEVANPAMPGRTVPVQFVVDPGLAHAVLPPSLVGDLRLSSLGTETFQLPGGGTTTNRHGIASISRGQLRGVADVVFGGGEERPRVGRLALASLGVGIDPETGELNELPMLL